MGEMEIEEIEAVLEKIWDLYDKLSDEIHLISRSHFLKSVKPSNRSEKRKTTHNHGGDDKQPGYVFIKGFAVDDNDSTMREAKSLNATRTALENLEDQLEFFNLGFLGLWGKRVSGTQGVAFMMSQKAAFMMSFLALQCIGEVKVRPSMPEVLSLLEYYKQTTNQCSS